MGIAANKIIPYGRHLITKEDTDAVLSVLQSDYLTQGPSIAKFETNFAQYIGVDYAVAVSNGTAALHLCALTLDVNEKSKVITTPITFSASANCIRYCGGQVDFVDIDPDTALMDLNKLYEKLKNAPKGTYSGIIPVDFAGYPVHMEKVRAIADEFNLWIIEDACHAPGGAFTDSKGTSQKCGNGVYADLSIFSFHPVKHIATGEGGMITTNNKALYDRLSMLRTHGITRDTALFKNQSAEVEQGGWYMEMQELGYNYRLCDMQAALGISQLNRADLGIERRRQIAKEYDNAFANTNIKIIKPSTGIDHAYHLYVIQVNNRKGLYDYLKQHNIYAQVHYIPVHLMPYYKQQGFKKGDFPLAEVYYEKCLSLPMYPSLEKEEQQFVIDTVLKFHS